MPNCFTKWGRGVRNDDGRLIHFFNVLVKNYGCNLVMKARRKMKCLVFKDAEKKSEEVGGMRR